MVPNYCRIPGITYPQGSEDVLDVLDLVVQNLAFLGDDNSTHVFALAHSAGGMHVLGYLTDLFVSSPAVHTENIPVSQCQCSDM
jgi:acetyl esterase/lipase